MSTASGRWTVRSSRVHDPRSIVSSSSRADHVRYRGDVAVTGPRENIRKRNQSVRGDDLSGNRRNAENATANERVSGNGRNTSFVFSAI